jgi:hypothetical protein
MTKNTLLSKNFETDGWLTTFFYLESWIVKSWRRCARRCARVGRGLSGGRPRRFRRTPPLTQRSLTPSSRGWAARTSPTLRYWFLLFFKLFILSCPCRSLDISLTVLSDGVLFYYARIHRTHRGGDPVHSRNHIHLFDIYLNFLCEAQNKKLYSAQLTPIPL